MSRALLSTPSPPRSSSRDIPIRLTARIVSDDESDDKRSYDTDITGSEASTLWSDSDYNPIPSRPFTPLSPDLVSRIPIQLRQRPELPLHGFTWYCPVKACRYEINLLSLTDDQRDSMPVEAVDFMTTPGWSLDQVQVQKLLLDLIEYHYSWHLDEEGVEILEDATGNVSEHCSQCLLILTHTGQTGEPDVEDSRGAFEHAVCRLTIISGYRSDQRGGVTSRGLLT